MAIQTASNIRRSTEGQWRTRDPINASDYAGIIEVNHELLLRIGATVPGWWGDWRTTSATYTQATTTSEPDLSKWLGSSRLIRKLEDISGDVLICRLAARLADASLRVSVTRVDSDGTETLIDTIEVTETGTSIAPQDETILISYADTREGGVAGGDAAAIHYTVEFKHEGAGTEAQLEAWHVDEVYDESTAAVIPGDQVAVNYYDDVVSQVVTVADIVAHYRLDEASISDGTTLENVKAGFDGSYSNGGGAAAPSGGQATLVVGGDGTAVSFGGDDAYGETGLNENRGASDQDWSIGLAVSVQDLSSNQTVMASNDAGGTDPWFRIVAQTSGRIQYRGVNYNSDDTQTTVSMVGGSFAEDETVWVHVTYSTSSNTFKLYVDGVEVETETILSTAWDKTGSDVIRIARTEDGTGGQDVTVDEVTFSDEVWTASQVQQLYEGGTGGPYP